MKKMMIALSLIAFMGSTAVAGTVSLESSDVMVTVDGKDKDKNKKKKKKGDCSDKSEAKSSCTKSASKSCCASKKKADK